MILMPLHGEYESSTRLCVEQHGEYAVVASEGGADANPVWCHPYGNYQAKTRQVPLLVTSRRS